MELFARLRWCVQCSFPAANCGAGSTVNCSHALVTTLLSESPLYTALKLYGRAVLPMFAGVTDAEPSTLFDAPTLRIETTVPVPAVHLLFGYSV